MELTVFEPKNILLAILLYVAGCGQVSYQNLQRLDLTLPKEKKPTTQRKIYGTISAILLDEGAWYCYPGSNIASGQLYHSTDIETLLKEGKKKSGDSFSILLKPTKYTSYKTTVNALDQMTVYKVKKFQMVGLSKEEEAFFYSPNFLQPPKPIEIMLPKTVTSEYVPEKGPAFYVHIKDDRTIWYKTDSSFTKENYLQLKGAKEQSLEKLIAQFKRNRIQANNKLLIYIVGDKNSKYEDFELVLNSLKKNEIYKYDLLTTEK